MNSPTPTVAVIGPGCIGRTYAASAAAGGLDVVLCGRRSRDPGVVVLEGEELTVPGPIRTDPHAIEQPVDLVLVCVKAHQTEGAADWLKALVGPDTTVGVLQNGIEQRQAVAPLVPESTGIVPAVVWDWAEESDDGTVQVRGRSHLMVPDDAPGRRLAAILEPTPSQVDCDPEFHTAAWRKLLANTCGGLLALPVRRAVAFRLPGMQSLARRLGEEVVAVARADGAGLTQEDLDAFIDRIHTWPDDSGTSILYDREQNRPMEWRARNEVIQRLGGKYGVPTPVSDVVVPLFEAADPPEAYRLGDPT